MSFHPNTVNIPGNKYDLNIIDDDGIDNDNSDNDVINIDKITFKDNN